MYNRSKETSEKGFSMKLISVVMVIYMMSHVLLFMFVYNENKKEHEEEKLSLFGLFLVSFMLSLIVTTVITFFLFIVLGSTTTVNMLFSLNISTNQLILLTVIFFIYLFTIDNIIEIFVKYIVNYLIIDLIIICLIRIFTFYLIALLVNVDQLKSFLFAIGVSLILLTIEILSNLTEKESEKISK